MDFTTREIPGADAVRLLKELRSQYQATGLYPFLIGDAEELEQLSENAADNKIASEDLVESSKNIKPQEWITKRQEELEKDFAEYGFTPDEILGAWPGEISHKGSIGLHEDVLTRKVKPKIYLGLAPIKHPWHLPAVLKYGGWNDCPEPEVHCAFHREWQEKFGAEITGMSGDVVECLVRNPPTDQETAMALAWEQYWYCGDIVDQGCETISNLAATLINSPYWYFWWD